MANYIVKEHNGSDGADSRTKSTFSVWVKRSRLGVAEQIWSWGENHSNDARLKFQSTDILRLHSDGTGSPIETARKFRDLNGWYHFVVAFDGSSGTEAHRRRVWINGEEWVHGASTSTFSTSVAGWNSTLDLYIGDDARQQQSGTGASPFKGYMSHFHYCDGYAYTASDFGEFDATDNMWKAIPEPSVNYGTHGIFLKMEDSSNMDLDSSPNASSQLSTTGTILSSQDCPSNNFATLNSVTLAGSKWTLANGNTSTDGIPSTNNWRFLISTLGASSGKYYFEVKPTSIESGDPNNFHIGIADIAQVSQVADNARFSDASRGYAYKASDGKKHNSGTAVAYGSTWTTNDIIGCAFDLDNNKIYFSKNGTWQDSGDPTSGATGTGSAYDLADGYVYTPSFSSYYSAEKYSVNFGNGYFGTTAVSSAGTNASNNGIFEYDVPTGYTAFSTKGINT